MATWADTSTDRQMPIGDLQDAVQYLVLGLLAYLLVAHLGDVAVSPLAIAVFLLGIVALVLAGSRLMGS